MKKSNLFWFLIIILAFLGILLGLDLTYVHYKTYTDPSYHSFCAISDSWNCQTVATSKFSVFFRLPISLWGIIVYIIYIFLTLLAISDTNKNVENPKSTGLIFVMGWIGLFVSIFLFYVSVAIIHSKCILCAGLYIVNILLLIVITAYFIVRKKNPFFCLISDLKSILLKFNYPLAVFSGIALVAVILVIFYPRLYLQSVECSQTQSNKNPPTCNEDATYGSTNPVIVITEFSDYECPYCSITHFALRKVVDKYPWQVLLKHRHFPLDMECNPLLKRPFHRHSCMAARAAVCAGKQSKFWEMSDLLYRNQKSLSQDKIEELAHYLKLDEQKFKKCVQDPETNERIKKDIEEASKTEFVRSGMVGTPILYIGNHPHIGGMSYQELLEEVESQLKNKEK